MTNTFRAAFLASLVNLGVAGVGTLLMTTLPGDYVGVWDAWDTFALVVDANLVCAVGCVVLMARELWVWARR